MRVNHPFVAGLAGLNGFSALTFAYHHNIVWTISGTIICLVLFWMCLLEKPDDSAT